MTEVDYTGLIRQAGLKVTPQRIAVLDAVYRLEGHPSSDQISQFVRQVHPGIATGTIYNILESFVDKGLLSRVKTERGAMLYDSVQARHHHLYCSASERIEDYYDEVLDKMLTDYFSKKRINGFEVSDIRLQVLGKFKN